MFLGDAKYPVMARFIIEDTRILWKAELMCQESEEENRISSSHCLLQIVTWNILLSFHTFAFWMLMSQGDSGNWLKSKPIHKCRKNYSLSFRR